LKAAGEIMGWIETFIAQPHPQMTRPGHASQVVCPFAQAAIDDDSLLMEFRHEVRGDDEPMIEQIVRDYIPAFKRMGSFRPGANALKTLLLVFPNLPDDCTPVLDTVQEMVKDEYVNNGLMLAQFHKHCTEHSVHNRGLMVGQSPRPFIAIRYMALHDILFLTEKREWFLEYTARFGEKFRRPDDIPEDERHLVAFYRKAQELWDV